MATHKLKNFWIIKMPYKVKCNLKIINNQPILKKGLHGYIFDKIIIIKLCNTCLESDEDCKNLSLKPWSTGKIWISHFPVKGNYTTVAYSLYK